MGGDSFVPLSDERAARALLQVMDKVHDYAVFLMDVNGIIVKWNEAATVMKGYTAEQALGSFLGMLYTDDEWKDGRPQANLQRAIEEGAFQEESWRRRRDGSLFWALIELIALYGDDGELTGFCKITRDLTSAKLMQEQLAAERERALVTLGAIGEAVLSIDVNGQVEYLNAVAEQLTGWTNAEAVGLPLATVFDVSDELNAWPRAQKLVELVQNGDHLLPADTAVLTSRSGKQYGIEDTASPIRLPDGRIVGGVVVFRDVTETRRMFRTATYQATHDGLTGLFNRAEFERRLHRSLERAQRSGLPGALLLMDLDHFKIVNDTAGHDAGDDLLRQIAHLYRDEIRERDELARLGGDEFALLADHCSKEEAVSIAQKILESTRNYRLNRASHSFCIGVSIGIATFCGTSHSTSEVLKLADAACFAAKQNGKNQIVMDVVPAATSVGRQSDTDWISRVSQGMRSNRLELFYQAIAPVESEQDKLSCEILLRMPDARQGLILPGLFLPAAERYDLMPSVDRWVVEHVVAWMEAHRGDLHRLNLCALNLSPRTLSDHSFLEHLQRLTTSPDILQRLSFEIMAQAALADVGKTMSFMRGLKDLGCAVALVGVGIGMPAFTQLRQLPVDYVKLDESAASAVTRSALDEKMVTSANEIVHLLGQKTIVEFVEDQATVELLSRIGVDYLQGRWIAPPRQLDQLFTQPIEEFRLHHV